MAASNKKGNYPLKRELDKVKADLDAARGKGLSPDKLKTEQNFVQYVKLLVLLAKRYTVFIAVSDTPCGAEFSAETAKELMRLGLKHNLAGMFRRSYAAIVNAGEVLYEKLSDSVEEPVVHECIVGNVSVELKSVGYDVPAKSTARIIIDGKNYSPNGRGLNFVVFDTVAKILIDAVTFDTFNANLTCRRRSALADGVLAYKKEHPGVSIVCFNNIAFPETGLSYNESFIIQNAVGRDMILDNLDKPVFAINKYISSQEDICEVLTAPKSYIGTNGVRQFADTRGRCVNISGGHRVTAGQPENYRRTVYIVGGCSVFGIGSADNGTIASYLQKLFNEKAPEQGIIVQNYGFYLAEESDAQTGEELTILRSLPARDGDIILCNFGMSGKLPSVNMSDASKRPHDYGEIFFDRTHLTEAGYRLVALKLFEKLRQESFFCAAGHTEQIAAPSVPGDNHPLLDDGVRKELEEYKKILKDFYDSMFGITIGAVVMNCNPFTLGHRYLVEQAAEQVDYLIIFVVQEDKSIFPFDDRLRLVDEGISGLKNVTAIPSGRFIISSLTFSEYFNKSEIQERTVDSSLDVTLFAKEIAPCLNISVRFAGEEPFDKVTKQYNDTMRAILPQHGIQFVEIPRKISDGAPISASRVRELLEKKDFDEIAKIVPETTLEYLRNWK